MLHRGEHDEPPPGFEGRGGRRPTAGRGRGRSALSSPQNPQRMSDGHTDYSAGRVGAGGRGQGRGPRGRGSVGAGAGRGRGQPTPASPSRCEPGLGLAEACGTHMNWQCNHARCDSERMKPRMHAMILALSCICAIAAAVHSVSSNFWVFGQMHRHCTWHESSTDLFSWPAGRTTRRTVIGRTAHRHDRSSSSSSSGRRRRGRVASRS